MTRIYLYSLGILKTSLSAAPLLVCRYLLSSDQSICVMKLELPEQVPTLLYLCSTAYMSTKLSLDPTARNLPQGENFIS